MLKSRKACNTCEIKESSKMGEIPRKESGFGMRVSSKPVGAQLMVALMVIVLAIVIAGCVFFWKPDYPDHTVESVDLHKYSGKWYEIASFPNWFQKNCFCTTAEYAPMENYVEVTNTCRKGSPSGKLKLAKAKAHLVPGTGNSQLKVQFQWPFKGDYWVIALDENYQHAMVGHPSKKYLWILSRTPEMTRDVYANYVKMAEDKGYDVVRLKKTDQSCTK